MKLSILCVFLVLAVDFMEANPVVTDQDVMAYLERYGYAGTSSPDPGLQQITDVSVQEEAIRKFQHMFHIPETGVIDEATREAILMPRCGVKDSLKIDARRKRRYAADGSKWSQNDLTYTITKFTSDMSRADVESEMARAFKVWSDVTPLTFTYLPDRRGSDVDIEIYFASYDHGDGNAFDGPGQVLAHAFFPQYGGDAHFDDSETYTKFSSSGVDLFQVAAHEIGHSLGLGHSEVNSALMAPYYRGYVADFQLDQDDISGIQYLYGVRRPNTPAPEQPSEPSQPSTTKSPVRPSTTQVSANNDYCQDGQFDTLAYLDNGVLFAFRGDKIFYLTNTGVGAGFPRSITDFFPMLPSNLDAAVYWPGREGWERCDSGWCYNKQKGKTFFFKGSEVWVYIDYEFQYKSQISNVFPGLPNDLDSAYIWTGNGQTYFTKGRDYYRVVTNGNGRVDQGYPRSLDVWLQYTDKSIRDGIDRFDSAVQWGGNTFFFRGKNYYKYDDSKFKIFSGYPRSVPQLWYGCQTGSNMAEAEEDTDQFMMVDVATQSTTTADSTLETEDGAFVVDEDFGNAADSVAHVAFITVISCVMASLFSITM